MPLFDSYVMMDWSASDRRRSGKQDCIWIAFGSATVATPVIVSPPSRTEAEHVIRSQVQSIVDSHESRVLVCADFGYGYPAGFSSLLPKSKHAEMPPWRIVWQYLSKHLRDDLGTKPGRPPTNRSNRFEVANSINAALSSAASRGPFWCVFKSGSYACIPQKRPVQPFLSGSGTIAARRLTDEKARSDTPFRLFGTGSVGGQVITGIPRLESIRFDPEFAACSAVWPFETGWAPAQAPWPAPELRVLHAEIYPSVRMPLDDTIKDRGQVRAMWHWARDLDEKGLLIDEFAIPPRITSGSPEDHVIRSEEGWILGCPH